MRGTNQRDTVTCPGKATVALPSREHGDVTLPTPPSDLAEQAARMMQRHVEIVEYPEPPLFRWPFPTPDLLSLLGLGSAGEPADPPPPSYAEISFRTVLENLGRPLLLAPSDLLPEEPIAAPATR